MRNDARTRAEAKALLAWLLLGALTCTRGSPVMPGAAETTTIAGTATATEAEAECPEVVARADWGAAAPIAVEQQEGPAPFVIVHHTYTPGACNSSDACAAAMRSMQRFHQKDRGWNDIGYNFAVGGDGRVYEGRGWGAVGAHAPRYNNRSIGICLIGDYVASPPPAEMEALAQRFIACGAARGRVARAFRLLGHRQVRQTECPGDAFYARLQRWPHWVPSPDAPLPADETDAVDAVDASTQRPSPPPVH